MRFVFAILAVLIFLGGCSILAAAKSAIHEIEAFMLFLIAAVFLVGGAIMDALVVIRKELKQQFGSSTTKRMPPPTFEFVPPPYSAQSHVVDITEDNRSDASSRELLGQAVQTYKAGDHVEARKMFQRVVDSFPETLAGKKAAETLRRWKQKDRS